MTVVVGITGGIGSGKTTLSNHLKKLGFLVHESDRVVSDIYRKPTKHFLRLVQEKISKNAIKQNKIIKTEITNTIFNNLKAKIILENYIHKQVQTSRDIFIKKYLKKKKKIIFVDVPLLFENNLDKNFDLIVCVISSKKNRTNRVLKNKKFSKTILNKILMSQTLDKERRRRSQIVITNNKTKKTFILNAEKALMSLIK
tara:strand:- start:37 stop:633 length:597 start_codon:yes stop_codon:yes gene_type:complete